MVLNFKHPESLAVLNKIIETSDVIVENFIPGVLKKYGLDYPTLAKMKPELVYASITGIFTLTMLTQAMDKRVRMLSERATMLWLRQKWD